ncbi:hypothetical protein KKG72_01685 [bacterium]|nr:hypothetical protein [bacterium]MBU1993188.1 hypothetical protein [bacterium]
MNEIVQDYIKKAEEDFSYACNVVHTKNYNAIDRHVDAIKTIFIYSCHSKLKVKDLIFLFETLPRDYELYKTLIDPFKAFAGDENMIAKKYGAIYLKYISEKGKGRDNEDEIIREIIFKCEDIK